MSFLVFYSSDSVSKSVSIVALATFAISIGFIDPDQPSFAIGQDDYAPFHGTAAAIDDHHLLTCAHLFEYDTAVRKADPSRLKYR